MFPTNTFGLFSLFKPHKLIKKKIFTFLFFLNILTEFYVLIFNIVDVF